jgi:hypothetical protein
LVARDAPAVKEDRMSEPTKEESEKRWTATDRLIFEVMARPFAHQAAQGAGAMTHLVWYCSVCRSLYKADPPLPRVCRCASPLVQIRPTLVSGP